MNSIYNDVFRNKYKDKKAYIYVIKVEGIVSYVGQTINFTKRIAHHKMCINSKVNKPIYNICRYVDYDFEIVKEVNFEDRIKEETDIIKYYESQGLIIFGKLPYQ